MALSVSVCRGWPALPSALLILSVWRMIHFRTCLINLLGLCLVFCGDHIAGCMDTVWQPPSPSIRPLQAMNDTQSLLVSWLVNHSSLMGDIYEIQIGRTENHTVIYNQNISLFSKDLKAFTWTWSSDLPLQCVDHSVRMRHFYNHSVPSPWSDWITNRGETEKDNAQIFPRQRLMKEHTSAMFCCIPPRGVDITHMTYNTSEYTLTSVGARVKAITVHNLTIPKTLIKRLVVACSDATGKETMVWNYISFPAQKPRNLRCGTSDMETVTCTWDSGRERNPFDRNKQTHTLNIQNSDRAPVDCQKLLCTFPVIPHMEKYNISVVVKDQLGEATESYSFNVSERVFPVVEVDRVIPGVTHTTVSWIVHRNLTPLDLVCQVTADPQSTTELGCSSVSGVCKVTLKHLVPNTSYSTRVRCSVSGRIWGEWTRPIPFTTYQLVTLDVWRTIKQLPQPNSRQVTLLWIPHAPGSAATVNIQGFTVQWSQEGQSWSERKDSRQTQTEVYIDWRQYEFTVQAVLHTGSSIPAHITIPQRDDGEILTVEKRLSSSTAEGFNLSWDNHDSATCGYTVEWCVLGNAVPCTLRWLKVPQGNNTLFLPAKGRAGCRYTFNIYGCTENGHRLLEVQTGYVQELKSVQSPRLAEPAVSTSSSVTLEWSYNEDDPAHPAFITGYLVTAQEVGSDVLQGPAADLFNVTVSDPQRKSVTIEGLNPNQEYTFSVSALTKEGPGEPTNITIRTRANYSAYLAKILTPVLLLLGCTILMWPQRKMLKEIFAYPAGMNIKTPELDSFLHETSEWLQSQKVEECCSCDIEILNTRPLLNQTAVLRDPEPLSALPSPGSQSSPSASSLSRVPLQADYCPQSVTVFWDGPALQQITSVTNKTYLSTVVEDLPEEQQVKFSEINSSFEPSENQQESFSVIYGYISTDTF